MLSKAKYTFFCVKLLSPTNIMAGFDWHHLAKLILIDFNAFEENNKTKCKFYIQEVLACFICLKYSDRNPGANCVHPDQSVEAFGFTFTGPSH